MQDNAIKLMVDGATGGADWEALYSVIDEHYGESYRTLQAFNSLSKQERCAFTEAELARLNNKKTSGTILYPMFSYAILFRKSESGAVVWAMLIEDMRVIYDKSPEILTGFKTFTPIERACFVYHHVITLQKPGKAAKNGFLFFDFAELCVVYKWQNGQFLLPTLVDIDTALDKYNRLLHWQKFRIAAFETHHREKNV